MIKITQLNHSEIVINAEMIEMVEATPDTIITLTTGRKVIAADSLDDVIERVLEYQRKVRTHLTDKLGT